MKGRRGTTSKFTRTKSKPVANHPTRYKQKNNCENIEFVVFTHSKEVEVDIKDNDFTENGKVKTIKLDFNIDPTKRGINEGDIKEDSRVVPVVYVGNRNLLGKNTKRYSLTPEDKKKVEKIFKNGIRVKL